MTYKKIYPSALKFDLNGHKLAVYSKEKSIYNPDIWGIKYLYDHGIDSAPAEIFINSKVSNTMALRMNFLKYLFPYIDFHDAEGDKYITIAKDIIENAGTGYITYEARNYSLNNRGTKDKIESIIERELFSNLSKYVSDFSFGVKVIRQFPANIFKGNIKEERRVTDKLWIDMVSINRANDLAPIELKVGANIPLDLFAQGLDYGIYCYLFERQLKEDWFNVPENKRRGKITIYYIGEAFHPALVGRGEENGIATLIKKNRIFNIVFVKIDVDKRNRCIVGRPEIIFDTRKQ